MREVEIVMPFPPSTNTAYPSNAHGRHLSKRGRAFKDEASKLAVVALRGVEVLDTTQLHIHIGLDFPNQRKCDIDNYIKLVKDVVCEVLHIDDDWTRIPRISVQACGVKKNNPKCIVNLTIINT